MANGQEHGLGEAMKNHYLLQFFSYEHLPTNLRAVSKPFCILAHNLVDKMESNPELTTALRKLMEAKDCAVRAELFVGCKK